MNVESLRVFMMLLIVIMHLSGGSIDLDAVRSYYSINNLWILCYRSITYLGVPCFAFISGYYGIKCNYRKFWRLECMALFYGTLIIAINFAMSHPLGFVEIRNLLLPASSCHLWYYSAYFLLALISPFITPTIQQMSNYQLLKSSVLLLSVSYLSRTVIMGFGNDFILLLSIYVIGQLLRRYPHNVFQRKALLIFFICQFANFVIIFLLLYVEKGRLSRYFDGSANPLTVLSSVCLFYIFLNINKDRFILRKIAIFAPSMLAVYMFHEGFRLSGAVDLSFLHADLIYIFPFSCIILIVISLFELCRGKILKGIENKTYDTIKVYVNRRIMTL